MRGYAQRIRGAKNGPQKAGGLFIKKLALEKILIP